MKNVPKVLKYQKSNIVQEKLTNDFVDVIYGQTNWKDIACVLKCKTKKEMERRYDNRTVENWHCSDCQYTVKLI